MAESAKTRLFKIASEINIGKDAIVDYLQSKGFTIENKPTSILTAEMCNAIYDKFKRERQAAEKQREKVEKQKQLRHPGETHIVPEKIKHEEKVELAHKELPQDTKKEKIEIVAPKVETPTPKKEEAPRIIIDLDAIERSTKGKGKSPKKELLNQ